jgi:hypothetical protein
LRVNSDAAVPAIVAWLVHQGVQIHAVQPRRKSLEDVRDPRVPTPGVVAES